MLIILTVLLFGLLMVGLLLALAAPPPNPSQGDGEGAHAHALGPGQSSGLGEALEDLVGADAERPVPASALLARVRYGKASRDRTHRCAVLAGRDFSRYLTTRANLDLPLAQRLRRIGVQPEDIDLPPAVAGLEEEILAPPAAPPGQAAADRNDGFFARRNQNPDERQ